MNIRLSFAIAITAAVSVLAHASAGTPRTISFQGVLANAAHVALPDGTYANVTFRLYDHLAGPNQLWSETKSVTLAGGRGTFSTALGDTTAFPPAVLFDQPYWLSVQVGADPEMTPRIALQSVPYALNASTLTLPFSGTAAVATPGAAVAVTNSSSGSGILGVNGSASGITPGLPYGAGVWGDTQNGAGVRGLSATGWGIFGQRGAASGIIPPAEGGIWGDSKDRYGVEGSSASAYGVWGHSTNSHGTYGESASTDGNAAGVFGRNTGVGTGVFGAAASGFGVYGTTTTGFAGVTGTGPQNGVYGLSSAADASGVFGGNNGSGAGVAGNSAHGLGVSGFSGDTDGVLGVNSGASGNAPTFLYGAGVNGDSANGYGVRGTSTFAWGVLGQQGAASGILPPTLSAVWGDSADNNGVEGTSVSGNGVWAVGANGVIGINGTSSGVTPAVTYGVGVGGDSANGLGVRGMSNSAWGVYGQQGLASGTIPGVVAGVWGNANANFGVEGTSGTGVGVWGFSSSGDGMMGRTNTGFAGVYGTGGQNGVYGHSGNNAASGVYGDNSGSGPGVAGYNSKSGGSGWLGAAMTPSPPGSLTPYAVGASVTGNYGVYAVAHEPPGGPGACYGVYATEDGTVDYTAVGITRAGVEGTSVNNTGVIATSAHGYGLYASGSIGILAMGQGNAPAGRFEGNLDVIGNVMYTGSLVHDSDERYKTGIAGIGGALETVMALRGVSYEYRADEFRDKRFPAGTQLGFIAQEVEGVLPELVHKDKNGYRSLDYTQVIPVLVEAVKAQQTQIADTTRINAGLLAQTAAIRSENSAMRARLHRLEERINAVPHTTSARPKHPGARG